MCFKQINHTQINNFFIKYWRLECLKKLNIINRKVCGTTPYLLDGNLNKFRFLNLHFKNSVLENGKESLNLNVYQVNQSAKYICKHKD